MNVYEGKSVLITGGSSGIGLALAKNLAAQGSHIWIMARRPEQLEIACKEISAARKQPSQQVGTLCSDVTDRPTVFSTLESFVQQHGAPDYLVNSAGSTYPGMFEDLSIDIFDQLMDLNYTGTVNVIKALLPAMLEKKSGHIVNVSSFGGLVGGIGYSAYTGPKFAIRGLSDVLRQELPRKGIKISVVFPPDTQTPQLEFENKIKPAILKTLVEGNLKPVSAEYVAEAIVKSVAKGKYIITPGSDTTFYYNLVNSCGIVYPILDIMLNQAWKKIARSNGNGSQKHQA